MSFSLLSLTSMYSGYLDSFYSRNTDIKGLPYFEHLDLLLSDTTEFAGSYIRNFRKLGVQAECIISNDNNLQNKWGLEHGINSDRIQSILLNQVKLFKPEILWIEDLNHIDLDWLNDVRKQVPEIRLIVAYHCAPFNKKVLDNLQGVDLVITCTPGLKSEIEGKGKKTYLVYHGFNTDLLARMSTEAGIFKNDFIFSGSLISGGDFHNNRIKLIEKILKNNIDIGLYVNLEKEYKIRAKQLIYLFSSLLRKLQMEQLLRSLNFLEYGKTRIHTYSGKLIKYKRAPVYGIDMYNLFSHSKIVLNFHIGVAGDFAGNMRMFEVTGVGSCLLTDNKKNMSELFVPGNEVVVYDNAEDCIEKVKWLLEHEDERKKIASSGQQRTLKYHTVENRCASIIEILKSELKTAR